MLEYLPTTTFKNKEIVNIIRGIKVKDQILNNSLFTLNDYPLQADDTRPDIVAYNYYDRSDLAWLVLLPNVLLDPYFEWPLSDREFDQWMINKYGSVQTAKSTILHYTHKTKDLTISKDTFTYANNVDHVTGGDYSPVYAYDYHELVNNNRRIIKLFDRIYTQPIIDEIVRLMEE